MYRLRFVFTFLVLPFSLLAQFADHSCGTDILKKKYSHRSGLRTAAASIHEEVDDSTFYTIPVVFHVVHQGGDENIPDKNITDALELLNKAFENSAPYDPARGVDTKMSFCLGADKGITRHFSLLTHVVLENGDEDLKRIGVQDPGSYVNIWVVKSISSVTMGDNVAGYAMLPDLHGSGVDGIVIEADFINDDPDAVKVLVHEMGHYLGLYHTFEGGDKNGNCLVDGDRVCDTPPDASTSAIPCHISVNTAFSDEDDTSENNPFRAVSLGGLGDQPDMHQNYMDYGQSVCQNTFTQNQKERMRYFLVEVRNSLLENPNACLTCSKPITASLDLPITYPAGVALDFVVTTSDAVEQVIWVIDGNVDILPGNDTLVKVIDAAKKVVVRAIVVNDESVCSVDLQDTIQFTCPVSPPVITADPSSAVSLGEQIDFSVSGSDSYQWFVDGISKGGGSFFSYTLTDEYGHLVTVEASNGTCSSLSDAYFVDPTNCNDSKENNVWYFGSNAGIDFNHTPPKAIPGKINIEEGCAVLCDEEGTPLFHATGESVRNSQTGLVLKNGSPLSGHFTTTQGALFAPQPGNDRYVYLFTLDYQAGEYNDGFEGGIHYSIIDKLGDGGNGEVIERNTLLIAPVVEKVTSVINQKRDGIWIIAHGWGSNKFYAWELTATGLRTIPVISSVGVSHSSSGSAIGRMALGEMKSSPSGEKIALAIDGQNMYQVFDFDNATGNLSNPITLKNAYTDGAYGVTFSPNERFVYGSSKKHCIRFDLSLGNEQDIVDSYDLFPIPEKSGIGSIQLAPDGKIYLNDRSNASYLSVISNPNAEDVNRCGYEPSSFKLFSGTYAKVGLPNPVKNVLNTTLPIIYGSDQVCIPAGSDTTLQYSILPKGRADYFWYLKGKNLLQVMNDSTVSVTFSTQGIDTLIAERVTSCGSQFDTVFVTSAPPAPFYIGSDTVVCAENPFVLTSDAVLKNYWWTGSFKEETLSRDSSVTTTKTGYYKLRGESFSGCFYEDSIEVDFYEVPLSLGKDTSICNGETLLLTAPSGSDDYVWSTGATGNGVVVSEEGEYWVEVQQYGCSFSDSIQVWKGIPTDFLEEEFARNCLNSADSIVAPDGMDVYTWQLPDGNIEDGQTVVFTDTGYYRLTVENRCGIAQDSLYYYELSNVPADTLFTCSDTLEFVTAHSFQSFQLPQGLDGITPADYFQTSGDTVRVYASESYVMLTMYPDVVKGDACILVEEIYISVDTAYTKPDQSIDLGKDSSYCSGGIFTLNAGSGFDSYRWNTGSRDSLTTVYNAEGAFYVEAEYCGFMYSDTIVLNKITPDLVDLGDDRLLCSSDSVVLDAGEHDFYAWSNGLTSRTITVSDSGYYSVAVFDDGCVSADSVYIADAYLPLHISGDSFLCEGEQITLNVPYFADVEYVWDSLGVLITGDNSLVVDEPGLYKVRHSGCSDTVWSDDRLVVRETFLQPDFIFSPDSVCEGKYIHITIDSSPYRSFEWQDGSSDNPKAFKSSDSPRLLVKGEKCEQKYEITLPVKKSGCSTPEKEECRNDFYLYPNPSDHTVTLGTHCPLIDPNLDVRIIQLDGQLIWQGNGNLEPINAFLKYEVNILQSGMYLLEVVSNDETYVFKWLVAH